MRSDPQSSMGTKTWVFYFDSDCRFCKKLTRWLSLLDFSRRITWTATQDLEEPPNGITWEALQRAAYLVDHQRGRSYEGFYAFRMLTLRMPALVPLAPLIWFPAMGLVGVTVYRWVARNRYRISRCAVPESMRRGKQKSG